MADNTPLRAIPANMRPARRLKEGMEIIIMGNLIQRRWKDAEGKTRSNFRVVARAISVTDLKRRPEPDYIRKAA